MKTKILFTILFVVALVTVALFVPASPVLANGSNTPALQTENPPADTTSDSAVETEWNHVWGLLKESGPLGLVLGVVVLLFVYVGEFTDIFSSGKIRQFAAIISSYLFAGVKPGDVDAAIVGALALAFSTLGHWLFEALMAEFNKRKTVKTE